MKNLYIGTSGYSYEHWKRSFYPESVARKKWLSYYAKYFNSVEINVSFYRSVSRGEYKRWYAQTPKNFRFAVKGHRYITHLKKLNNVEEAVCNFFSSLSGLADKIAVVLWQFPGNFSLATGKAEKHLERLRYFLTLLPKEIKQAFEFRHESWYTSKVGRLLQVHNASLVVSDSPAFPTKEIEGGDFVYLRFHGPTVLYGSRYTSGEMRSWAERIRRLLKKKDAYCFFNNDSQAFAIRNALELGKLLGEGETKFIAT